MTDIFEFIIRVSVCTSVLYLFYLLFFSGDTFYFRNRIFLLSILLLSVFIPSLSFFSPADSSGSLKSPGVINSIIVAGNQMDSTVTDHMNTADINFLLLAFYFAVGAFFLFRSGYGIVKALIIINKGKVVVGGFPRIVLSDFNENLFSFFPFIVIPRKLYYDGEIREIVEHEKVHVRQLHTFDLLLCELLISLQWFNPFIWLIKRSIVLNHEYQADNLSIVKSGNRIEYQHKLLDFSIQSSAIRLTHNFSHSIKKRLIMINKKPTQSYAAMKGLLAIPVVAVLFLFFSFRTAPVVSDIQRTDTLFSKSSISVLYQFIFDKIGYPEAAKDAGITGKYYVLVKMGKGGVVKECSIISDPANVDVPLCEEIVIVGYRPSPSSGPVDSNDYPALKAECLSIANKLGTVDIPEWKDKNMAFILNFSFMLK